MQATIRKWLFARGINVSRQTPDAAVLDLIRRLRPKACGKELIRVGGHGDGGYLIPDDLEGIEYCFSPGVSTQSHFEEQLADRGIRSFLADYSVDAPPVARAEFTFDKKFLGASDGGNYFMLSTWKNQHLPGYADDLLLQMDIEGSEYEVILSTPEELLNQLRIMVIEVHGLDKLFDCFAFGLISAFFNKVLRHFQVVHIHPNNCCGSMRSGGIEVPRVAEFTFLNRARIGAMEPVLQLPHPLDEINVGELPELPLARCWYAEIEEPRP